MTRLISIRRIASSLLLVSGTVLLATCGRDSLAPRIGRPARIAISPIFPAGGAAGALVMDSVLVTVTRSAGDTVVVQGSRFPSGSSQVALGIVVPLVAESEELVVSLDLLAGPVLLFHGSDSATIHAGTEQGDAVPIPMDYVGPGASVAALFITPRDTVLRAGDSLTFGVAALNAQQQPVSQFYTSWSTSSSSLSIAPNGRLVSGSGRATISIVAVTATGIRDSTSLSIVPAATRIAKSGGDAQSAIAGDRLPIALAVRILAADSLPVPGASVTFAVTSGGGTVDNPTATTDGAGIARSGVVLGGTTGTQSYTASLPGGPSVTFSAMALPAGPISRIWTGLLGLDWSNPGNWSPLGIPTLLDNLTIGTAINLPVLSASVVAGSITIDGLGVNLTLDGHTLVTNSLSVINGATITLDKTLDSLLVGGSLSLDAGNELGKLTAGVLTIGGDFTQLGGTSPNSFAATGLRTILNGSGNQTLNFANPGTGQSHFADLLIDKTGGAVTLASSVITAGNLNLLTPTSLGGSNGLSVLRRLTAVSGATLGVAALSIAADSLQMARPADYAVTSTTFNGGGSQLIPPLPFQDLVLSGGGSHTLANRTIVSGVLRLTGTAASLVPAGHTLSAASLVVSNAGLLRLTQPLDSLLVAGGFDTDARSEVGNLTAGVIAIGGNFIQRGTASPSGYAATGTRTVFNGSGNQQMTLNNPAAGQSFFHDLVIAKSGGLVNLASPAVVTDSLALTTATTLNSTGILTIGRKLRAAPGAALGLSALSMTADSLLVSTPANYAVVTTTFNGAGPQIIPALPYSNLNLSGTSSHSLSGRTIVTGTLGLDGATASLVPNGQTLAASALTITKGAILRMIQPSDSVLVNGPFDTDGGDESASLTNGILAIAGNLTQRSGQSASSFAPSGTRTILNGSGNQTVTMASPGAARSHFHDLIVNKPGGTVQLPGVTSVNDSMAVTSPGTIGGAGSLTVRRKLRAVGGAGLGFNSLTIAADSLLVATPASYNVATTIFDGAGPQLIPLLPYNDLTLSGGSTHTLTGPTAVAGTLSLTSSAANLVLGGRSLRTGTFLLSNGGLLTMTQPLDSLLVSGGFDIDARNTGSSLTAGLIAVGGDFTQRGSASANSFAPTGTRAALTGAGNQTITFANPGVTQSGFRDLELRKSGGAAVLASPVFVDSSLTVASGVDSLQGGTLTAGALNVTGLVLNNTPLTLNSLHAVAPVFNNSTFLGFSPAATQFTISQVGIGLPISLTGLTFLSTPTTGYYVSANETGLVPLTVLIQSNLSPTLALLLTQLLNGALVTWQ